MYLSSPSLLLFWWRSAVSNWLHRPKLRRWVFTRSDGEKFALDAGYCTTCKNNFWFRYLEYEVPSFCPYCGVKFTGFEKIDNAKMKKLQP